ncbi:MAG: lytic murein transglycosylase, partial [Patescibacteria group bacterium]
LENSKKQKQKLLNQTKGQEKAYQQLLSKAREDLDKIRNQPYNLAMGFKMTFEEALKSALPAAQLTGARAAFIMAIVKIESDWGGNVGKGNWRTDMHPRDFDAFQAITSALGINPDSTPVSKKPYYGWGGAMGPAQFLPSTWLLYADAVANLMGRRPASPWNIEDAFTAAGLKLAKDGADKQTYAAESKAAKIYIAGSRWNTSLTARIYANNVMAEASRIQKDINILNQSK